MSRIFHARGRACARPFAIALLVALVGGAALPSSASAQSVEPIPSRESREGLPAVSSHGHADEPGVPEEIVITGRTATRDGIAAIDGDHSLPVSADTSSLARIVPGADVNSNGPLSGQLQYRGLAGARMNVRVDGGSPLTGGPNWMDPPLHYAPRPLLDRLEFERGVSPVSSGAEGIGGSARAVLLTSEFSDGDVEVHGDLDLAGRAPRAEFGGGGLLAISNDWARLHVVNATEFGTDWRSPEGTVRSTKHERYTGGIGGGFKLDEHEVSLDYRHFRTQDTGSPALPMDVRFFDTEILGADWSRSFGAVELSASLGWNDIDHGMDNFSQRRAPATPAGFRKIVAHADRIDWRAGARAELAWGVLEIGIDGYQSQYDANVSNPNAPAFFVNTFRNVERDRYSAFAELNGPVGERGEVLAGFRYTRVDMDAGTVDALPSQSMGAPMLLRNSFNAADRSKSDDHYDYALRGRFALTDALTLEAGHSRKSRSPTFFERYAWLPLEVTGGLADGNNYVGNIDLDPEVSYELDFGIEANVGPLHLAPRAFYRYVDQFIQGVPVRASDPNGAQTIGVSSANGDTSPLRYANVDAELWGIDAELGIQLPLDFYLDATLSYVRAKRKDVRDELYRIAPLRGRAALAWLPDRGSIVAEVQWASRQDRVSDTNGEFSTDGYAIVNLIGTFEPLPGVELMAGVENIFDNLYRDHLAGINRNADSSTALLLRLPGRGATGFARLRMTF